MQRSLFSALITFMLLLAGCSVSDQPNGIQSTPIPPDATRMFQDALLTATYGVPTSTPVPPTNTPPVLPSPTPTRVVYSQYHVSEAGIVDNKLFFTIVVPGIEGEFWAMVNNEKYACFTKSQVVDTLYCSGSPTDLGSNIKITVFPKDSQQAAMAMEVHLSQGSASRVNNTAQTNQGSEQAAVSNSQPVSAQPVPVQPKPTQVPCPDWCGVFDYLDGHKIWHCGFATPKEAHTYVSDIDIHLIEIPDVFTLEGYNGFSVKCGNKLEYYLSFDDLY